jgi:hypothetical protein
MLAASQISEGLNNIVKLFGVLMVFIFPALLIAAGLIYNLLETQSPVKMLPISIGGSIANIIFLSIASLGKKSAGVAWFCLPSKKDTQHIHF